MLKKISAIILMAAVAVSCTACGSNNKNTPEAVPSDQTKIEGSGNMGSVTSDQLEDFSSGTKEQSDTNTTDGTDAPEASEAGTGTVTPNTDNATDGTDVDSVENVDNSEDEGENGSLNTNSVALTLGDYRIAVVSCQETLDINNCHALRVEYSYTNNSDSQATFATSILTTANQGTIRLANTSPASADPEYSAQLTFVQSGETVTCAAYYLLDNTSTDVVINIANMLSSNDNMSLTYSFNKK